MRSDQKELRIALSGRRFFFEFPSLSSLLVCFPKLFRCVLVLCVESNSLNGDSGRGCPYSLSSVIAAMVQPISNIARSITLRVHRAWPMPNAILIKFEVQLGPHTHDVHCMDSVFFKNHSLSLRQKLNSFSRPLSVQRACFLLLLSSPARLFFE